MQIMIISLNVLLLPLQVVFLLTPACAFPQSIDELTISEICRFADAESVQMQESENDGEIFREHEEYTIDWVVSILRGRDIADEIAEKHGFVNVGLISLDEAEQGVTLYKFVLNKDEVMMMPRYVPYENKTQMLTMEEDVLSAEQKTVQIQCSKMNEKSVQREKRQSRAANLRTTWFSSSVVIFSWDHPVPPPNYYRLIHSAIDVSNGFVICTRDSPFTLSATVNHYLYYTGVSRDDINIFHLNAVYGSTLYSAIWLGGQATLPAPAITEMRALDCNRVLISWQPPSIGAYTYAVVVYDGTSIIWYNKGAALSHVLFGLSEGHTYLVFVVAMNGNSYGASYKVFTMECYEEGDLRLIQGPNTCEGHLQVLFTYNGQLQWGSACDRRFGREEMQVACRKIGCPVRNPLRRSVLSYGGRLPGGTLYRALGHSCTGTEGCLEDCLVTGSVCNLGRTSDIIAMACR